MIMMILLAFMLPFALLGVLTVYHWLRPQKAPADTSNRINKIRLWWFALTREDKFVFMFPWLKKDEWENLKK
jgi:hypothetical protein